jgi:hypothetical protein
MQLPWPCEADRLFRKGGLGSLAACAIPDHSVVATGYKSAAGRLIAQLSTEPRDDSLLFPILFCYRQYVELRLKAIAASTSQLTGEKPQYHHRLLELWAPLRDRLRGEVLGEDLAALAAVDNCIAELSGIDFSGTVFRYPDLSSIKPSMLQIDLGNLKAVMERLSMFLEALQDSWEDL